MSFLPYAVAAWLLLVGLYGAATSRNYVHLIVCLSVAQSGTYALLLAIGYAHGAKAPLFSDLRPGTAVVDPVVQSLALTDVVVEAVVVALLLALAVQAHKRFGTLDPDEMQEMRG